MSLPVFEGFPKIPRYRRNIIITEKIDGTNAQIYIPKPTDEALVSKTGQTFKFLCGSRSRWIFPEADNYGFATWSYGNEEEILKLGPGHHFGEWWGQGIQRRYGLTEKRFSLFNVGRWEGKELPTGISLVPQLYAGVASDEAINGVLIKLALEGSVAAPGFMLPEGIVIYHTAGKQLYKITVKDDERPKGVGDAKEEG